MAIDTQESIGSRVSIRFLTARSYSCPVVAQWQQHTAQHLLTAIAEARGQSLAQLALLWVLRHPQVTSALIGASSVQQLDANLDALDAPALTADEIAAIEPLAVHGTGSRR